MLDIGLFHARPGGLFGLTDHGGDIASQAELAIPQLGNWFTVSGGRAITRILTGHSRRPVTLVFAGAATITHSATHLIVQGGASYVTSAGDMALVLPLGDGKVRAFIVKASSAPGTSGPIKQVVFNEYTANADLSTALPEDDTIPQNTEGTEVLTGQVTTDANDVVIGIFQGSAANATANIGSNCAAFVNSVTNAIGAGSSRTTSTTQQNLGCMFAHTPGAGTHDYKIRVGAPSGSMRLNAATSAGGRLFGGVARSVLILIVLNVP